MVFIPDLSTACIDPFTQVKTLSMLGDVYVTGDTPKRFEQDPRAVAARAEEYMKASGFADEMRTGPEFEFYVFDGVRHEISPNRIGFEIDAAQAVWNSNAVNNNQGYTVPHKGGYHTTPPADSLYDLRSQMCMLLEPLWGEAGSGFHVHMHLFNNNKPLFYDADGYSGLSTTALYFIGGLLKHAPALCAWTNPSTNSYKRLVPGYEAPGYEAPVSICYATANRNAVIRIPDYAKLPDQKRFEIRSPDATCNPYYAFSAILMAGLDGIEQCIDPVELGYGPYDTNMYHLPKEEQARIQQLPVSLEQSLDALEKGLDGGGIQP